MRFLLSTGTGNSIHARLSLFKPGLIFLYCLTDKGCRRKQLLGMYRLNQVKISRSGK